MTAPAVTILILNWNGKKFLQQFLPSVMATRYDNFTVLLADNGSTDDSVAFTREHFPAVKVLELGENFGFAEGNNRALRHVKTPYVVLLNSDVEVHPDWLTPLVEAMERNPDVAAVQPRLLEYARKDYFEYAGGAGGYIDVLGYPFCRGRIFDITEKDNGQYEKESEIFWSTGACMLVRKSVTDRIGLFEGEFFAHQEEIDFCWRSRNYGYRILYCPDSRAWHVGGGTLKKTNPKKTFLNARNSLISMFLNFPAAQLWWKIPARLLLDGVWGIKAMMGGHFSTVGAIIRAHFAFYFRFGFWLSRRRARNAGMKGNRTAGPGYYPHSIVWQHFVKGVNRFADLKLKSAD